MTDYYTPSGRPILQDAREVTIVGIATTGITGSIQIQPGSFLIITGTIYEPGSASLFAGVQTGTVTPAALNNGVSIPCREVLIQNQPINAINVLVGIQALRPIHLVPGDIVTIPIDDVSKVWIATPSGTSITGFLGRT